MKVGTHKKSVLPLWGGAFSKHQLSCVYKNFTAIDTHTRYMKRKIIQLRLNDTNGIENFVKNFAKATCMDTSKEAIEARTTEISKYLTK